MICGEPELLSDPKLISAHLHDTVEKVLPLVQISQHRTLPVTYHRGERLDFLHHVREITKVSWNCTRHREKMDYGKVGASEVETSAHASRRFVLLYSLLQLLTTSFPLPFMFYASLRRYRWTARKRAVQLRKCSDPIALMPLAMLIA